VRARGEQRRQPRSSGRSRLSGSTRRRLRGELSEVAVAYLGPPGTFTEEALRASITRIVGDDVAVLELPIEGGGAATLDALAELADRVAIKLEVVHPISHCLVSRTALPLAEVTRVYSHPLATAQCGNFLRRMLPAAERVACASTAEAVRTVVASMQPWAALGSELAAKRYGATVLARNVADHPDNETRFVWVEPRAEHQPAANGNEVKTSVVFWGGGDEQPGWLVSVLGEFASRGINLTRIESRPRRIGLGHYMFFCDLEGSPRERRVADALAALTGRVEELRVLGSYPVLRTR
jgi:prephenate dehydratase